MKLHGRIHTGDKSSSCEYYDLKFTRESNMKNYVKNKRKSLLMKIL